MALSSRSELDSRKTHRRAKSARGLQVVAERRIGARRVAFSSARGREPRASIYMCARDRGRSVSSKLMQHLVSRYTWCVKTELGVALPFFRAKHLFSRLLASARHGAVHTQSLAAICACAFSRDAPEVSLCYVRYSSAPR